MIYLKSNQYMIITGWLNKQVQFIWNEEGNLHASIFSDVTIRRVNDFSIADVGEKGIIQTKPLFYSQVILIVRCSCRG